MDNFLEALLDPVAEAAVGLFFEDASSIRESGWSESKCGVQTLLVEVWWHPESSNRAESGSSLGALCSTLAAVAGFGIASKGQQPRTNDQQPT
jgi:hypothetical protein